MNQLVVRICIAAAFILGAVSSFGQVGISLSPNTIGPNQSSTATVSIGAPAPSGGYAVNVSSQSSYYVPVPTQVTIPAGATSANFSVSARSFSQTYTNVIQVADSTSKQRTSLTVFGNSIQSISFNPSTLLANQSSTGTVTLSSSAPVGGWNVFLTSSAPSYVSVARMITIAQGTTTGSFQVMPAPYLSNYNCVIQASDSATSSRATLNVESDSIASLKLNPNSVSGGDGSVGTITLNSPAPTGGWVVNLVAGHSDFVSVPATVTVPGGATTATFVITTQPSTNGNAYQSTIVASDLDSHEAAVLYVTFPLE